MSYVVHNFQTGEVIEAQPINEMDAQIMANAQAVEQRIPSSAKGAANGVASLDASGKVPSAQIPVAVTDDNNGNVTLTI